MANQQLFDYIQQQTKQGVSRNVINKNLISKGWQHSDINEAFSQLTAQNSPQPAMPASTAGDATKNGKATASLVLGIIGIFTSLLPLIGLPVTIIGLIFGIKGLKSLKRGMATAGIVLSITGLLITVVNISIGAYLGATGQLPVVNKMLNNQ